MFLEAGLDSRRLPQRSVSETLNATLLKDLFADKSWARSSLMPAWEEEVRVRPVQLGTEPGLREFTVPFPGLVPYLGSMALTLHTAHLGFIPSIS